jgi:hypothetical protein
MSQSSLLDPFALWRDLVSEMEKGVNDAAAPSLGSAEFVAAMNQALSASVAGKALKREMMNRYLRTMNLPTRSDVEALSDRLHAIEDRLIGMSATLDRLAGVRPGGSGPGVVAPPRTKRPPAPMSDAALAAPAAPSARAARGKSRRARP